MSVRGAWLMLCAAFVALDVAAHEPAPSGAIDYDAALAKSQAAIGRPIGNHALIDTRHRALSLADYRGKPLVVSFVYTGCNDVCSLTTRFLADAVGEARSAFGADRFNVVTVGFNHPFDTPEAMAAFARQNGVRDGMWAFLSTDAKTIDALAHDFGFTYYTSAKGIDHVSQISIVDAKGIVYRQIYAEAFEVRAIAAPLKELLAGEARSAGFSGLLDKVKLFCTVYDPRTRRYRANYTVFVEIFAGASVLAGIAWFLLSGRRRSRR